MHVMCLHVFVCVFSLVVELMRTNDRILVCKCGYMCCSVLILLGLKETGAAFENHLRGLRLGVASGDLEAL